MASSAAGPAAPGVLRKRLSTTAASIATAKEEEEKERTRRLSQQSSLGGGFLGVQEALDPTGAGGGARTPTPDQIAAAFNAHALQAAVSTAVVDVASRGDEGEQDGERAEGPSFLAEDGTASGSSSRIVKTESGLLIDLEAIQPRRREGDPKASSSPSSFAASSTASSAGPGESADEGEEDVDAIPHSYMKKGSYTGAGQAYWEKNQHSEEKASGRSEHPAFSRRSSSATIRFKQGASRTNTNGSMDGSSPPPASTPPPSPVQPQPLPQTMAQGQGEGAQHAAAFSSLPSWGFTRLPSPGGAQQEPSRRRGAEASAAGALAQMPQLAPAAGAVLPNGGGGGAEGEEGGSPASSSSSSPGGGLLVLNERAGVEGQWNAVTDQPVPQEGDEVLHRPRDRSLVFSQEKGGFVDVRNPDGPVQPVVELGRNACVRRSVVDDIQEKRNSRKISALHMLVSQQASQARPDGHRPATSPGLPQSGYVMHLLPQVKFSSLPERYTVSKARRRENPCGAWFFNTC